MNKHGFVSDDKRNLFPQSQPYCYAVFEGQIVAVVKGLLSKYHFFSCLSSCVIRPPFLTYERNP